MIQIAIVAARASLCWPAASVMGAGWPWVIGQVISGSFWRPDLFAGLACPLSAVRNQARTGDSVATSQGRGILAADPEWQRPAVKACQGGLMSGEMSGAEPSAGFSAGSRIAGYRLEEQVGRGGMAVVFRALDERLGRQVALKVLAPGLAADEAFRHRFIRESRSAAAVDHPHIVPVFEAGEANGVLFLAMRYVPGGDVGTLARRLGPMPPARAAAIISSLASALDA